MHLGCDDVVLVGCDASYGSAGAGDYFYAADRHTSKSTDESTLHAAWAEGGAAHACYEVAAREAERRGVTFCDATIDGMLTAVPKCEVPGLRLRIRRSVVEADSLGQERRQRTGERSCDVVTISVHHRVADDGQARGVVADQIVQIDENDAIVICLARRQLDRIGQDRLVARRRACARCDLSIEAAECLQAVDVVGPRAWSRHGSPRSGAPSWEVLTTRLGTRPPQPGGQKCRRV